MIDHPKRSCFNEIQRPYALDTVRSDCGTDRMSRGGRRSLRTLVYVELKIRVLLLTVEGRRGNLG